MNTESGKGPIFKVYSEDDKKVAVKFYLDEELYKEGQGMNDFQLDKGLKIQHLPNNAVSTREIIYLAGRSGSGKSYYAREYIKEYKKKYKNREVYLFTYLTEEDETLRELDIKKFKLDQTFLDTPLEIDFFEDSLVIFDDCESISDKAIYKKVKVILDKILQTGRHKNISCIYTSHILTNNVQTKLILNECHTITIFPTGLPKRNVDYLMEAYLGFDKTDIKRVKRIKSRWITFLKTFPALVFHESGAFIPTGDDV